jgi:glucose/arabinose dehydrogenase
MRAMILAVLLAALVSMTTLSCGSDGGGERPVHFTYAVSAPVLYVGQLAAPNANNLADGLVFSVTPSLPAGLAFNAATGEVTGTPTAESALTKYTVRATRDGRGALATFVLRVDTLPTEILSTPPGFAIERLAGGIATPDKMTLAPGGKLFVSELTTGRILVGTPGAPGTGSMVLTTWATIAVETGIEKGLYGLACSPTFDTDGFVYCMGTVANPLRQQVIRLHDQNNTGVNATVIVDNLPAGDSHNGGDLKFLPDGTLLVSVGDTGDENLAQDDLSLAGRLLRYNADGTIPADNPNPASPEYVRGLRNVWDMAVHPVGGQVFGSENGPAANDELIWVRAGNNFAWPTLPLGVPGAQVGINLRQWPDVIVPTGLAWHQGQGWGSSYSNSLFIGSYHDNQVLRFPMSGAGNTDIDSEDVFLRFNQTGFTHKPLDLEIGPDGSLYVTTFEGIWRVWKPE